VEEIATPWCPYTVAFSRDGMRLAIGGGSGSGDGGIAVHRLQDSAHEYLDWRTVLHGVEPAQQDAPTYPLYRECQEFRV
jgi:hypothetical protein